MQPNRFLALYSGAVTAVLCFVAGLAIADSPPHAQRHRRLWGGRTDDGASSRRRVLSPES
jgi:hypothetical protein